MRCHPISHLEGAIHELPEKTSHALERILLLRRGRRKAGDSPVFAELAASSLRAGLRGGEKHFGLKRILWQRSEWRDLLAFGFPLRGTGKPNNGIHQCLHWFMQAT